LAATATLAGGGQLLTAAPAAAMIGNDPACTYQEAFWIDQFLCINSNDDEGGVGGFDEIGSGRSIAPVPVAQSPKPPQTRGHETVRAQGRTPDPPCDRANPCAKVGGPSVPPRGDRDAGRVRDEGRAHGGTRPTPCKPGANASGCLQMNSQIECLVKEGGVEKTHLVDTPADCKRLNRQKGNESTAERELRRKLCDSLSRRIPALQHQIDYIGEQIAFADPTDMAYVRNQRDLKRSRSLRFRWLFNNEEEWRDEDCTEFPTPKDAEEKWDA